MSSVSQIIPNYFSGGISDQPDELKKPGQLRDCVNAFPDVVKGLYKRPGLEKVSKLESLCEGDTIKANGNYFHFSRENVANSNKQDYIGYVSQSGKVTVFRCSDGVTIPTYYTKKAISPNDAESIDISDLKLCSRNNYLTGNEGGLKFTTVNNYTFITNPEKAVTLSSSNNGRPYEAFIEVTLLAYNRAYLIDIDLVKTDVDSSYRKATEVSITSTSDFEDDNAHSSCPANFIKTVTLSEDGGTGSGLIVEIESVGVPVKRDTGGKYKCVYRHTVDLVNGGRDWKVGDTATYVNTEPEQETTYVIEVTKTETVSSSADYQITDVLTPSNGDEVATIKSILDDMRNAISSPNTPILKENIEIVGNGLYMTCESPFTVTTSEKDLMNILSNTDDGLDNPYCIVNNAARLPIECKDGLVVLVANSFSDADDYWVQFNSNYGDVTNDTQSDAKETAATGYWVEVAEPKGKVTLNPGTMPQALVFKRLNNEDNERIDAFIVGPVAWKERTCGNETFNPSFSGFNINNLLFYRNRLCALSQENVIMTRAGELFNFFPTSALAVSPSDPIDISAATDYSSILQDGLVINNALLLFSQLQQFQLTTDSDVLAPNTAKILEISRYNYNARTSPINIGTNVGFISDRGGRAKVYELSNVFREGSVKLIEKSKIVSESFLSNVKSIASSPEDELILFANNNQTVWLYKFLDGGDKLLQDAWVKWTFPHNVINHFVIDSTYYAVLDDNNDMILTRIKLESSPTKGPFKDLWENDNPAAGTPFAMTVNFPTINVVMSELGQYRSDTNSSLVIHRLHYNFGDIGTYNFEILRDGYDDYNILYESRYMDKYLADTEPLVPEVERTIPVYTRNTALDVVLTSNYDQPLILHSMRWEGDYNSRYYKRV